MLTRTSRALRTVRTGYAYQSPARPYVQQRPEAQGSSLPGRQARHYGRARTSPWAYRTYRVPSTVAPQVMSKRIIDYRKAERTSATKDGRQTWNYGNWATLMKV